MKIAAMKVELIDSMGTDLSVVNAARVSMHKESEWDYEDDGLFANPFLSDKDAKLIDYLAKHKHWTPFSHPQLSFRIKAPIFVARQWFKHMIGITRNETSRRYVDEEPEFWFPEVWRGRPEGSIKQGSSGEANECDTIYPDDVTGINWTPQEITQLTVDWYNMVINNGVAPEQARIILPQNMMTEWIETASLAAVCRSVKLRLDLHAQAETREIAEQIAEIVVPLFPVSWSALMEN